MTAFNLTQHNRLLRLHTCLGEMTHRDNLYHSLLNKPTNRTTQPIAF